MRLLFDSLGIRGLILGKVIPYSFWFTFCVWVLKNKPEKGLDGLLIIATVFAGIAQMVAAVWNAYLVV